MGGEEVRNDERRMMDDGRLRTDVQDGRSIGLSSVISRLSLVSTPMPIGLLSIHLRLAGCASLKEKRGRLKPLLARLHREFNVSTAEMDLQDVWQDAVIACALVNSDAAAAQRSLQTVLNWIEREWLDVEVIDDQMEIF
jgi:uncharacterized protein